ncbi:MAG: hypothetical protein IJI45_11180 [Anaerolineaceae bacterium]|nr:hypothetical protein [Anaerolineaceae bacterium]
MGTYSLNKRELQYLMSQYNSDVMGIGYSLGTDPQEELRIQESLLSKGYAISDFDCAFSIDSDLLSMLSACNQWQRIVHFTSTSLDREEAFDRFFIIDDIVICESKKGEAICIEKTSKELIDNKVSQVFAAQNKVGSVDVDESYLVSARRIEILSQLRKERLMREIQNDGCPVQLSEHLANAISGKGEYASVAIIERTATDIHIRSKLTICCLNEVFLIIHPETMKEKQYIRFELGTNRKLESELAELRRSI